MSSEQQEALQLLATLTLARRATVDGVCAFVRFVHGYEVPPHQRLIIEYFLKLTSREWLSPYDTYLDGKGRMQHARVLKLSIVCPPGHGKTEALSWCIEHYIGRHPEEAAMIVSKTYSQATDMFNPIRATFGKPSFLLVFPHFNKGAEHEVLRERDDELTVKRILVRKEGTINVFGADGPITSLHFHGQVMDDIIDAAVAGSKKQLDERNAWYDNTFVTRREDEQTFELLVMTRQRYGDTHDYLMRKGNWAALHMEGLSTADDEREQYATLSYPYRDAQGALQLADERILIHQHGPALWPEKMPAEGPAGLRQRKQENETTFARIYQGRPSPDEGNLIGVDWFGYYAQPIPLAYVLTYYDTAAEVGARNDYTAWLTGGVTYDGRLMLLHGGHARLQAQQQMAVVFDNYRMTHPTKVMVEDTTHGKMLVQMLSSQTGVPIEGHRPTGKKAQRLERVLGNISPLGADGSFKRILVPEGAAWVADFVAEVTSFPFAEHDDFADCLSGLVECLYTARQTEYERVQYVPETGIERGGY